MRNYKSYSSFGISQQPAAQGQVKLKKDDNKTRLLM